jgi:hypothetical protein
MSDIAIQDVEVEQQLPALREVAAELSVTELQAHVGKIQEVQRSVMKDGEHYGVIPGTDKPTLLKPGAEKLCLTFRLAPSYTVEREWDGQHLTVHVTASLSHAPTGTFVGEGLGLCSTRESKYAERTASRVCPSCGAAAIIKGKAEYGGGWLCWKKKDGCGAKYNDGDETIESQESGKVENDHLADTYNTVVKMAKKRALVDAVLTATAASDIFAQDLEEKAGPADATPSEEMPSESVTEAPRHPAATERQLEPAQEKKLKELHESLEKALPSALRAEDWTTTIKGWIKEQFPPAESSAELNVAQGNRLIEELELWLVAESAEVTQ